MQLNGLLDTFTRAFLGIDSASPNRSPASGEVETESSTDLNHIKSSHLKLLDTSRSLRRAGFNGCDHVLPGNFPSAPVCIDATVDERSCGS